MHVISSLYYPLSIPPICCDSLRDDGLKVEVEAAAAAGTSNEHLHRDFFVNEYIGHWNDERHWINDLHINPDSWTGITRLTRPNIYAFCKEALKRRHMCLTQTYHSFTLTNLKYLATALIAAIEKLPSIKLKGSDLLFARNLERHCRFIIWLKVWNVFRFCFGFNFTVIFCITSISPSSQYRNNLVSVECF